MKSGEPVGLTALTFLRCLFELSQALLEVCYERLGLFRAFALGVHDGLGRAGDEGLIGELLVLSLKLGAGLLELLFDPRALLFEVDQLGHGHEHLRAARDNGDHAVSVRGSLGDDVHLAGVGQLGEVGPAASNTSGLSLEMMSLGRLEGGTFISALRLRTAFTVSMMSSEARLVLREGERRVVLRVGAL